MPTLKKQTLYIGYLKIEVEIKVFEPGEPIPANLRDSSIRLSDEALPDLFKPGERQFCTGVMVVYYNKNTGEGEPDWVNLLETVDLPVVVMQQILLKRLSDTQAKEIRALKGMVTKLKEQIPNDEKIY